MVNFVINMNMTVGPSDSAVPSTIARVTQMYSIHKDQAQIVGVSGYTIKSTSELLGLNFITAPKNGVLPDPKLTCINKYGPIITQD